MYTLHLQDSEGDTVLPLHNAILIGQALIALAQREEYRTDLSFC